MKDIYLTYYKNNSLVNKILFVLGVLIWISGVPLVFYLNRNNSRDHDFGYYFWGTVFMGPFIGTGLVICYLCVLDTIRTVCSKLTKKKG